MRSETWKKYLLVRVVGRKPGPLLSAAPEDEEAALDASLVLSGMFEDGLGGAGSGEGSILVKIP